MGAAVLRPRGQHAPPPSRLCLRGQRARPPSPRPDAAQPSRGPPRADAAADIGSTGDPVSPAPPRPTRAAAVSAPRRRHSRAAALRAQTPPPTSAPRAPPYRLRLRGQRARPPSPCPDARRCRITTSNNDTVTSQLKRPSMMDIGECGVIQVVYWNSNGRKEARSSPLCNGWIVDKTTLRDEVSIKKTHTYVC
ncbi:hypothetical protein U9M48_035361 [Paspalum notatum var. saurae]|uniref:Uncharacterized protein n=1 Tax=Paspalum notatum var. saurae TaxID=547442 RepID=A0AAQ3UCH9_PASNO